MDFSQFQGARVLRPIVGTDQVFQAFLWTARIDLRMLDPTRRRSRCVSLGTAAVLCLMLDTSGQGSAVGQLDALLRLFVGRTDEMTFAQLKPLLYAAVSTLDSVTNTNSGPPCNRRSIHGGLGLQLIPGTPT